MALVDLSEKENKVVYECIKAAAFGPFFPDTIFHTLFGVEKAEMQKIASEWPNVVESSPNVMVALNNSLNNLTGYPHNCHDIWSEYISVPADEVLDIFYKWLGKERPNPQKWDGVIMGWSY